MNDPCDRLRSARHKAGFKGPAEAARRFGWNINTYKSHENGERGFDADQAKDYGKAFHTSAGWLLTGEGERDEMPTLEEMSLVLKYRGMTPEKRQQLQQIADVLGQSGEVQIEPEGPKRGQR